MHRRFVAFTAILAALVVGGPVLASHVAPQFVSDAESCGPLTPGTAELVVEVPQGLDDVVEDGTFSADVALDGGLGNGSVSFSGATLPVKSVFIAGQDGGNLYVYDEPVTADDGLVAPDGQPVREVSLCYVTEGDGGSGSGSGDVAGATSEPTDVSQPATDLGTATRSPLLPVVLVAAGIGLVSVGLVLLLPKRRPDRS